MSVELGMAVGYLDLNISNFMSNLRTATSSAQTEMGNMSSSVGNAFQSAGRNMTTAGLQLTNRVTMPLVAAGKGAIDMAVDFEHSMSKVQAISGASGDELDRMTKLAREMGSTTIYEASEAAEALQYMALAGWDADQMCASLESILKLAAAGEMDLGRASDIVTDGMSAMGVSADKANDFCAILAQTMASSNTDVEMLGEGFKYIAPLAGQMGMSIEDLSFALGLMANNGVKASMGGTSLRRCLLNMTNPSDTVQAALDRLGISMYTADGRAKGLKEILDEMRAAYKKAAIPITDMNGELISDEELMAKCTDGSLNFTQQMMLQDMAVVAGTTGLSGMLAILGTADDTYNDLYGKITTATQAQDGYTNSLDKMYATMTGDTYGAIKEFQSALSELKIEIGELLIPQLTELMKHLLDFIRKLQEMPPEQKKIILGALEAIAALGPLLIILGQIANGIGAIIKVCKGVGTVVKTVSAVGKGAGSAAMSTLGGVGAILSGVVIFVKNFVDAWKNGWDIIKGILIALGTALAAVGAVILGAPAAIAAVVAAIVAVVANLVLIIKDHWTEICDWFSKTWASFKEGWVDFWSGLGESISQWWSDTKEGFSQWWSGISEGFSQWWGNLSNGFSNWWSDVKSGLGQFWENVKLDCSTAWSSISSGFSNWWSNVSSGFQNWWGNLTSGFSNFWSNVSSTCSTFWSNLSSGFSNWWSNLSSGFQNWWNNLTSGFTNFWNGVSSMCSNFWNQLVTGFQNCWNNVVQGFTNMVNNITQWFSNLMSNIQSGLSNLLSAISSFISNAWSAIQNWVTNIVSAIQNLFSTISSFLQNIFSTVMNGITQMASAVQNWFSNLISTVTSFFSNLVSTVSSALSNVWNAVSNMLSNIWSGLQNLFSQIGSGIKNFLSNVLSTIREGIQNVVQTIKDKFANIGREFVSIGWNMIEGLWNGIKNAVTGLYDKVVDVCRGLVDRAKSALGINSPSRVFADEVGKWIPPGIEDGVGDALPGTFKEIEDDINESVDGLNIDPVKVQVSANRLGALGSSLKNVGTQMLDYFSRLEDQVIDSVENMDSNLSNLIDKAGEFAMTGSDYVLQQTTGASGQQSGQGIGVGGANSNTSNTFIFNSPKAINEIEAARQMEKAQRALAEGFA